MTAFSYPTGVVIVRDAFGDFSFVFCKDCKISVRQTLVCGTCAFLFMKKFSFCSIEIRFVRFLEAENQHEVGIRVLV